MPFKEGGKTISLIVLESSVCVSTVCFDFDLRKCTKGTRQDKSSFNEFIFYFNYHETNCRLISHYQFTPSLPCSHFAETKFYRDSIRKIIVSKSSSRQKVAQ